MQFTVIVDEKTTKIAKKMLELTDGLSVNEIKKCVKWVIEQSKDMPISQSKKQ